MASINSRLEKLEKKQENRADVRSGDHQESVDIIVLQNYGHYMPEIVSVHQETDRGALHSVETYNWGQLPHQETTRPCKPL